MCINCNLKEIHLAHFQILTRLPTTVYMLPSAQNRPTEHNLLQSEVEEQMIQSYKEYENITNSITFTIEKHTDQFPSIIHLSHFIVYPPQEASAIYSH